MKEHGWKNSSYDISHNHARGAELYLFRNYMLRNLGLDPDVLPSTNRILLSAHSSTDPLRSMSFEHLEMSIRKVHSLVLHSVYPNQHW